MKFKTRKGFLLDLHSRTVSLQQEGQVFCVDLASPPPACMGFHAFYHSPKIRLCPEVTVILHGQSRTEKWMGMTYAFFLLKGSAVYALTSFFNSKKKQNSWLETTHKWHLSSVHS